MSAPFVMNASDNMTSGGYTYYYFAGCPATPVSMVNWSQLVVSVSCYQFTYNGSYIGTSTQNFFVSPTSLVVPSSETVTLSPLTFSGTVSPS